MRLFALRMARRLGHPTARHFLRDVTARELTDLAALELLDPPVEQRIDAGFASLMSLVYNRTRGKDEQPKDARDFLPDWGPTTPEEVQDKVHQLFGPLVENK